MSGLEQKGGNKEKKEENKIKSRPSTIRESLKRKKKEAADEKENKGREKEKEKKKRFSTPS